MVDNPLVECACGCGNSRPKFNARGQERKFLPGHNSTVGKTWSEERKAKLSSVKRANWRAKFPEGRPCKECLRVFPIEAFIRYGRCRTLCHDCSVEETRIKQATRDYGLSREEVRRLRRITTCEICGNDQATHIDHDHETGKVRGKLCSNCNSGIGMLKDNPDLLLAAVTYLLRNKDVLSELQGSRS